MEMNWLEDPSDNKRQSQGASSTPTNTKQAKMKINPIIQIL
jgi:hypothetical protein